MKRIKGFLQRYWDGKSPLLLGYSGGPDSKALLYALIEAGCKSLHIAHLDHAWRDESANEAELIGREIGSLGLPFYTQRLSSASEKNVEAFFREERFRFFHSLFQKIPFQALILGHQAEDLAETVLKRFFEGSHLASLGGMQEIGAQEGFPIWRPLLKIRKKEILAFLEKRSLKPFFDPTNRDTAYLRARLREETLPFLARSFGKEFIDNLALASERAYELKHYLDEKIRGCRVAKGTWGWALCLKELHRIEQRHLLQREAHLPRTVLEPLLDWVEEGGRDRNIFFDSQWIVASRGWVLFLKAVRGKALPEKGLVRKLMLSLEKEQGL